MGISRYNTFIVITLLLNLSAYGSDACRNVFVNNHNVALQKVMQKMQEYEFAMNDFVAGLTNETTSRFLQNKSSRTTEDLESALAIVSKYERLLEHLIEHSDHKMMSPKILSLPPEQQNAFKQRYKEAYVHYHTLVTAFKSHLEDFRTKDPNQWEKAPLSDLLREMNTAMGNAHNRL